MGNASNIINNQTKKIIGSRTNNPSGDDVACISSSNLPLFNMYRGYFPLWRKIVDWGWYKDSNTKAVFLHLLLTMNHHKDSDFKGHKIKKGQCVHGRKELSAVLGLSEMQIRTSIKHLISTNEITIKATNKFTIYTLTNSEKYFPSNYLNNQPRNQQTTNKQPTSNQQVTTSNNVKNVKNVKKEIPSIPFSEIISDLNAVLKTSYKLSSVKTQQLLKSRWAEGYRLEDFKAVHQIKNREWKDDPKMSKYLRPETLYGNKFESYLNQKEVKKVGYL